MESQAGEGIVERARGSVVFVAAVIGDTVRGLFIHDAFTAATTVAFSLLFALFPALILVGLVTTHLLGMDNAMLLGAELLALMPGYVAETVEAELANVLETRLSGSVFTFGAAAILVSVSGLVESIRYALARAYNIPETRHVLHRRLTGLVFVAGVLVTLISVAALNVVIPLVRHFVEIAFPDFVLDARVYGQFPKVIALAMVALMLIAMHLYLPPKRMSLMEVLPGVAVTVALYWVLSSLFVVYLTRFSNLGATYGGLAGIVTTMLYFQICGVVLIAGAEMNRAIGAALNTLRAEPGHGNDINRK